MGRDCFFSPWRLFITFALEGLSEREKNSFLKLKSFVVNCSLGLHVVKLINAPKIKLIKSHLYGQVLHPLKGNHCVFWYTIKKLWVIAEHNSSINIWPKTARLATHMKTEPFPFCYVICVAGLMGAY